MSLVFSDTSANKAGILQECETHLFGDNGYGRITNDSDLKATFTRYCNEALNRVVNLILNSDGRWQFDDTNFTDYPIGTTMVTTNQKDYIFDITAIRITRVEVKDSAGNWHLLKPIDQVDVYDQALTTFLNSTGLPQYYDKLATSIFLYPTPNYTQTASLKVYFQRPPSYFTVDDTTRVPGFNSMYHRLIPLIASRDYAVDKQLSNAKDLSAQVAVAEDSLVENYALRNKDQKTKVSVRQFNYN